MLEKETFWVIFLGYVLESTWTNKREVRKEEKKEKKARGKRESKRERESD